jgi:hypothetical protein
MHRSIRSALALSLALAAFAAVPAARAEGDVAVELTANRVTRSQGRDVLEATLPIPRGTHYIAGSATPRRVEASLDGHTFAPVPLTRQVRLPDGRTVTREVPASEYVALRWSLGALPAKQERAVTARVRIQSTEVAIVPMIER